jgi:hypothetical protein
MVVLAMLSVAVWAFLNGSNRSVRRTDKRREARFLMRQVIDRVESADFLILFKHFGSAGGGKVPDAGNPLLVDEATLDALRENKWVVTVKFRFMTRSELYNGGNVPAPDPNNHFVLPPSGILPYQGAFLETRLDPLSGSPARILPVIIKKPLYCPLILGRPGLTLAQCPALNEALQQSGVLPDLN